MKEQELRIVKTGECPSLSGQSTLTYRIGLEGDKELCISLTGNTGKGIFNKDWVALKKAHSLLSSQDKITSGSLLDLFEGKSSNSAGFILAVLLKEGLLKVSEGNQRHYELVGQTEQKKILKALIETAPKEKPAKKKSGKKGRGGAK